jgi:hypothetical protein
VHGHISLDPGQSNQTIGIQMVVEPNGTLIDRMNIFSAASKSGRFREQEYGRSDTHERPRHNVVQGDGRESTGGCPVFTLDGKAVRTGDMLPAWVVDPDTETIYVTWHDSSFAS